MPVGFDVQLDRPRADFVARNHHGEACNSPSNEYASLVFKTRYGDLIMVLLVHPHGQSGLFAISLRIEIQERGNLTIEMLLSASDESGRIQVVEADSGAIKLKPARTLRQGPVLVVRISQEIPAEPQFRFIEIISYVFLLPWDRGKTLCLHFQCDFSVVADDGPSLVRPRNRRKKRFPAQVGTPTPSSIRAVSEKDHPPTAILRLNQIAMPGALDGTTAIVSVCQYWIARAAFKRPPRTVASRDGNHVAVFRSSLRNHKEIPAVYFVEMGAFGMPSSGAGPDRPRFRQTLAGVQVYLALNDTTAVAAGVIYHAIVIEEQGRIAVRFAQPDGFGPLPGWILSMHVKRSPVRVISGNHIETAVVNPEGGRKNAAGTPGFFQRELALSGQAMADLPPVHQVPAVKNRHPRKILKATGGKVEVIPDTADARVGIKARNNRIMEFHG